MMSEIKQKIHYCKSLKNTQKPIVVLDVATGKEITTDKVEGYGHWRVVFNNATGKAKRSGATTVLEVW